MRLLRRWVGCVATWAVVLVGRHRLLSEDRSGRTLTFQCSCGGHGWVDRRFFPGDTAGMGGTCRAVRVWAWANGYGRHSNLPRAEVRA